METRLVGGDDSIWADGVVLDPDTVAAVEVKHTGTPGSSPYDGTAPPFFVDRVMEQFDDELRRYGQVIADAANPVTRLRLVVSDQASADFLGPRVRAALGSDIDLEVVVAPARGGE